MIEEPEGADLPAAGRVPHPHRCVKAAGEDLLAVRGKSHGCYGVDMPKLQSQRRGAAPGAFGLRQGLPHSPWNGAEEDRPTSQTKIGA